MAQFKLSRRRERRNVRVARAEDGTRHVGLSGRLTVSTDHAKIERKDGEMAPDALIQMMPLMGPGLGVLYAS